VLKIKRGWSSSHFGGNSGNYGGCGVKCGLRKSLNAQTSEVGLVTPLVDLRGRNISHYENLLSRYQLLRICG
jgi:hypothetical protein